MTDDVTEPTTEPTEPADETPDAPDQGERPSREAARYRTQLRDTEAERDALRASLSSLRTAAAESALAGVLHKPASLWLTGANAEDYYDQDGRLDVGRLLGDAQRAQLEHGLARSVRFKGSADQGASGTTPAPRLPATSATSSSPGTG